MTPDTEVFVAAKELDKADPKWFLKVTEPLDMSSTDQCVLAQVFGSFDEGWRILSQQMGEESFDDLYSSGPFSNAATALQWESEIRLRTERWRRTQPPAPVHQHA